MAVSTGFGTYANRNHMAFWPKSRKPGRNPRTTGDEFIARNVLQPALLQGTGSSLSPTQRSWHARLSWSSGLAIVALGVNALPAVIVKGPTILASLLPMIVTPLIGSLILFWMVDADGIIGATLQLIFRR